MAKAAIPTRLIENELVRVTEWRFAPGASTGFHRHEYDYVVVPVRTGPLVMTEGGEEKTAELVLGQPYFRPEGVEHDVMNRGDQEIVFIEVEIK